MLLPQIILWHFHNSQVMGPTQVSLNRGINEENIIQIHMTEFYLSIKNEIMSFAGKRVQLEIFILCELSQPQKSTSFLSFVYPILQRHKIMYINMISRSETQENTENKQGRRGEGLAAWRVCTKYLYEIQYPVQ